MKRVGDYIEIESSTDWEGDIVVWVRNIICWNMVRRRSKRKSTVLEGLTKAHGGLRRSKRKLALKEDETKIYGDDYGILPSDWSHVGKKFLPLASICRALYFSEGFRWLTWVHVLTRFSVATSLTRNSRIRHSRKVSLKVDWNRKFSLIFEFLK